VFFSDADCTFAKNWIEEGVKALEQRDCDGVEGRVVYVNENYRPTMADALQWLPKAQRDKQPSHFVGANVAYRKEFVDRVGGFDQKYTYLSDRGLGLKVARQGGRLCFSSEMIVYHPREIWTVRGYVKSGASIKNRAHLFKDFGDRDDIWWRVVSPRLLLMVVCPPLVVLSPFVYSFQTWKDFRLLPFIYFRALYGRLWLWRECIRERVFLI
jgi:GT2 family glycosyltransferase